MRFVFVEELIKFAKKNNNVHLITSDLGYRAFEKFAKIYPKRFLNVGVSESNMVGVAAGMAMNGKKVFVYSILPFVLFRSLEQIRNNVTHNNLDIKIIGAGGGFSYNVQGISHNTSEDMSISRSLPNLSVYNPGSKIEAKIIVNLMFKNKTPCFVRLGKAPDIDFYDKEVKIKNNEGLIITSGKDLTIFVTGNIIENVYNVVKKLQSQRIKIKLISLPILKPVNNNFILKHSSSKKIMSIEENVQTGGLGSLLTNLYFKFKINKKISFKSLSLKDKVHNKIGSQSYLRKINELDEKSIMKNIRKFLNEKY
jgi:transketolase